jgi:hypothetical protein
MIEIRYDIVQGAPPGGLYSLASGFEAYLDNVGDLGTRERDDSPPLVREGQPS